MKKSNFSIDKLNKIKQGATLNLAGTFDRPMYCPHCSICAVHSVVGFSAPPTGAKRFILIVYQCPSCGSIFACVYTYENNHAAVNAIIPEPGVQYEDEIIQNLSPRFANIYNQALNAASRGDYELASMGCRCALEILVKDYAASELQKTEQEVSGVSLANAIGLYLPDIQLKSAADVVRILGNDFSHYKRKHEDYDFNVINNYLEHVIGKLRIEYILNHPPVSRECQF